ncbi:GOLPH3/VPS74 family protein [Nocardioides hwasunensis]|uniref:GPP34 family phosphoprotein n=1 Tax=Nocardioides hwasunensis TaxID=397258 RepID=A0ABR8MK36_9ACTN|nr:GPP34 family phosphoprotein [Nocardioides hwasunensis]MBD3914864.1 GPP34 family phosphoprotein [Nocardioides hwasunensis]
MLISEELFLLLRRDDGRPESATAQRGYGLAATIITDLVVAERVSLSEDKDPRVTVTDPTPVGHPATDAALARLREKDGKRLSSLVTDSQVAAERHVAEHLAAAGVVEIEEKRALGLVPARYPVIDSEPERRIRERLRTVLAGGSPQPADSALLGVLQGLGVVSKVLSEEKGTLGRRELKKRIDEVACEVEAGAAVTRAVAAMNAAVMAAATAAAGAAAAGAASS